MRWREKKNKIKGKVKRKKERRKRKKREAVKKKKKERFTDLNREEYFSRRYVVFSVNGNSESIEIGKARNTKPVSTLFPRYRACGEDNERKRNSVGNRIYTFS